MSLLRETDVVVVVVVLIIYDGPEVAARTATAATAPRALKINIKTSGMNVVGRRVPRVYEDNNIIIIIYKVGI